MGHRIAPNPLAVPVTRFQALDGSLHETEEGALASSAYKQISDGIAACTSHNELDEEDFICWLFKNFNVTKKESE